MNQNDFREGRSTVSQILTLQYIIEEVKINNLPAILTFVDFYKALDSIDQNKIFKILAAYGIPTAIIKAITVIYTNTMVQVITEDRATRLL